MLHLTKLREPFHWSDKFLARFSFSSFSFICAMALGGDSFCIIERSMITIGIYLTLERKRKTGHPLVKLEICLVVGNLLSESLQVSPIFTRFKLFTSK